MLVVVATVVAFGWTFGVALIALGRLVPQGWMVRDLGESQRARRFVMGSGVALLLFATLCFLVVDRLVL